MIRIFEDLRDRGYDGGYDAVRRYARRWSKERGQSTAAAYVPLSFAPGEAYQFDSSHVVVLLSGTTVMVKAAHVRLCHSRILLVRAYPREAQEMVFDAHDRAFVRPIQGHMQPRHLRQHEDRGGNDLCRQGSSLQSPLSADVQPLSDRPGCLHAGVGREKGQVENQVGLVRERFFTPRLRFKNLDELNAWLLDKCIVYAKAHRHAVTASVSKTSLVRFDNNKYSVAGSAVGRPVEGQAIPIAS
ncbi:hypothetical protein M2171_008496 [Bradyrhizobium japonicum USDA 38]|nr:hypothetical protein [Bradyrhizobium japonicum USDA 38]MCS3942417.1 hypothetical protein [Bradyrhizobium japonicum]